MHVLLAHERFLFRFGVDRVLILYGIGLKALGWKVSVIANRVDHDVVRTFADSIILVPESPEYKDSNEFTLQWLEGNWESCFPNKEGSPNIAIVGGWPFIKSISFWKERAVKVAFSDHGVVPMDGYDGCHLAVLQKLKGLRRENLPHCDAVIAVSDFILTSQSNPDAGKNVEKIRIYNGVNHMDCSVWRHINVCGADEANTLYNEFIREKQQGKKLLLNLGRWEEGNYKNSRALYDVVSQIAKVVPNLVVGLLAREEEVVVPSDLKGIIMPLGFPGDDELQELMRQADLGLSVSLWEGFNLPLGEMQWIGKPVLAFRIGAHPEVTVHPWFLCSDSEEMVKKSIQLLTGVDVPQIEISAATKAFRNKFNWQKAVAQLHDELLKICTTNLSGPFPFYVLMDVSNASKDPANSGVIRVTRRVAREVQRHVKSFFIIWDERLEDYRFPTEEEYDQLGKYNGPRRPHSAPLSTAWEPRLLRDFLEELKEGPIWLLFSETVAERNGRKARAYAKNHGFKLSAIFYDSIALLRPELVRDENIRENHAAYMRGLAECDLVMPISHFSSACLNDFFEGEGLKSNRVVPNQLPGELAGCPRNFELDTSLHKPLRILCVSTLEPRKNHLRLIEACERLSVLKPDLDWRLTLIGNKYAGAFDLADSVQLACERNPNIEWLGVVDDETLHAKYSECTFTVYASEIEGFGLPIMESIWHGRPCVCHSEGVMAELAHGGGCLTTDVRDLEKFSQTLLRLATDRSLYDELVKQAVSRRIKSWDEYIKEMIFAMLPGIEVDSPQEISVDEFPIDKMLYQGCILENWQMNHSERLALMALLHRHRPRVAVEVGTFRADSLSLISQYAEEVYSIDIDPSIPEKYSHLENVTFLTGSSVKVLPFLLRELNDKGKGVDFILIDGDHSGEAVTEDLNTVLHYTPIRPLLVAMHDSFNPDCRNGMRRANWDQSDYLHFVDLDFIPGRLIEHGGGGHGELRGGLGLAVFMPERRRGPLCRQESVHSMFECIRDYSSRTGAAHLFDGRFDDRSKSAVIERIDEPIPLAADNIRKTRILVCSSFYPPDFVGGAELIAHYQAKEFCNQGHEVEVFAGTVEAIGRRHSIHTGVYDGVKVHRVMLTSEDFDISRENFRKMEIEEGFANVLREFRPDVVHCHNLVGLTPAVLRIAKRFACVTVLTVHDYWGFCYKNTLEKAPSLFCATANECHDCLPDIRLDNGQQVPVSLRQSYLNHHFDAVDAFISPSRYLAQAYINAGFPASKMHVVWNGIDLDRFGAVRKKPCPDCCRFTFMGYFGRHKGLQVLLEALLHLQDRKNIQVKLVGDGEERGNIERFVSAHGLDENVKLLGKMDNSRIEQVLAETDVLVLPSIWPENQPVSITEAMASHIPGIATNTGGIPELIEDGRSGMLFDLGNSKQLAEKMAFFAANPDKIQSFGEAAFQRICSASYSTQILRLLTVYENIRATRSNPTAASGIPMVAIDFTGIMDPVADKFLREKYPLFTAPRFILASWLDKEELSKARFVWVAGAFDEDGRLAQYLEAKLPILVPASNQELVDICYRGNCGLHYADIHELGACVDLLLGNPDICRELGECSFRFRLNIPV